jgi:hypothetical protein
METPEALRVTALRENRGTARNASPQPSGQPGLAEDEGDTKRSLMLRTVWNN